MLIYAHNQSSMQLRPTIRVIRVCFTQTIAE